MQVQLYMSRENLKKYNDSAIVHGSFVRGLGDVIQVYVDSSQIDYTHIPGMPSDAVTVHPIKINKEIHALVNNPSVIDGDYVNVKLTSDIASVESHPKSFFNKSVLERALFDPKELNGQVVTLHVHEEEGFQFISAQKGNTAYLIAQHQIVSDEGVKNDDATSR